MKREDEDVKAPLIFEAESIKDQHVIGRSGLKLLIFLNFIFSL